MTTASAGDQFLWPWQHSFPPFFTLQPNSATRAKQIEAWRVLVLDYCKHHKIHQLDVTEIASGELFHNKEINRSFSTENITNLLDTLAKKGHVEWTDLKTRKSCIIMWRTPEEWGNLIYAWATAESLLNTVCTFYEIISGEETAGKEFHGIEKWLLIRALKTLQLQGKAELITFDGNEGVKFF